MPRLAALLFLLLLPAGAAAQPLDVPPVPKARREAIPPAPDGTRYVWQPGYWAWMDDEQTYLWRPGRYVVRRPGTTRFDPPRWVQSGGDWVWRGARWR